MKIVYLFVLVLLHNRVDLHDLHIFCDHEQKHYHNHHLHRDAHICDFVDHRDEQFDEDLLENNLFL